MSIVPSSRIEAGHTPQEHLKGRAAGSPSDFEQQLVRSHIEDVLDGRAPVDLEIVTLAGGYARFEEQMDYVENVRLWQASRQSASVWRRLLHRMVDRIRAKRTVADPVRSDRAAAGPRS